MLWNSLQHAKGNDAMHRNSSLDKGNDKGLILLQTRSETRSAEPISDSIF